VKKGLTIAWMLLLASVPLWLDNLYVLHVFIITGIFIIAAMSLNLLLGYTGQLSLGHVAFFGIGAYTSSLTSLGFSVHLLPDWQVTAEPKPVWLGMLLGTVLAGLCGWAIGRISFKVRGAYFVIVTVSFAEVVRLVALNWVELTQGPMALNNIPYLRLGLPGWFELSFLRKPANYWLVLAVAIVSYIVIRRLVHSRAGRAMIALRENDRVLRRSRIVTVTIRPPADTTGSVAVPTPTAAQGPSPTPSPVPVPAPTEGATPAPTATATPAPSP
jgi:branched-chain amino acid transport system permease protein